MAYTTTNWQRGDLITAAKLNKLETAVAGISLLPAVTDADNGGYLTVVNGEWIVMPGANEER